MTDVLLATRLKVSDPTARTALATLRDRLGLADRVGSLVREELFLFEVDAAPAAARELVEGLARETNLFLNPNKHAWRVRTGDEPVAGAGVPVAWLLAWTPEDGAALEGSVHRHLGLATVESIRRGWLWQFGAVPGVDAAALLHAAREAAFGDGALRGFLVHDAWQEGRLYVERPSVYDVREAFGGAGVPTGRRG
jgi:hypothetical protein